MNYRILCRHEARLDRKLLSAIAMPFFFLGTVLSAQTEPAEMFVTAEQLSVRSCPSTDCGRISWLLTGQKVTVFETSDGWARISKSYDAACVDGISEYVDSGQSECTAANGIIDGNMAEWVSMEFLTAEPPSSELDLSSPLAEALSGSDNYQANREVFISSTYELISQGICTEGDVIENGGWAKATGANADRPIFFIYCGGFTTSNRWYLDASTGRFYQ
jgi:hypothetical protein